MAVPWVKLDTDFIHDRKIRALLRIRGWAGVGLWFGLVALVRKEEAAGGCLNLEESVDRDYLEDELRLDSNDLDDLINDFVECKLLDASFWKEGRITSNRLRSDAEKYRQTSEHRTKAGKASGAKRRGENK